MGIIHPHPSHYSPSNPPKPMIWLLAKEQIALWGGDLCCGLYCSFPSKESWWSDPSFQGFCRRSSVTSEDWLQVAKKNSCSLPSRDSFLPLNIVFSPYPHFRRVQDRCNRVTFLQRWVTVTEIILTTRWSCLSLQVASVSKTVSWEVPEPVLKEPTEVSKAV